MTELGPARHGKHSKHQRVTGMTAPGVATPSKSLPGSEESLVSAEFVSQAPSSEFLLPPPLYRPGRRITLLIQTPLAFDSITIPLVAEVATLQEFASHANSESTPTFPLWVPNGMQITPHDAVVTSGAFRLVYGASPKWWTEPEFILRFAPEGGPYVVPAGTRPHEPYPREETLEAGEFVRHGAPGFEPFGRTGDPIDLPPPQAIPVASWRRSPWLADGLMVGEGNCTPNIGAGERAIVEAWENLHGPVNPIELAVINAEHRKLLEHTATDTYGLKIGAGLVESIHLLISKNACFVNPFGPECTPAVNAELHKLEEELAVAQAGEGEINLVQHALDGKPYRRERGPWMNGVDKWGWRMDLHKPSLFPGVDFTKDKGTLMLEIRPSDKPFYGPFQSFNEAALFHMEELAFLIKGVVAHGMSTFLPAGRLVAGTPTLNGWVYDWPTWSEFVGPLGEDGHGQSDGPSYFSKGHGHGQPSTVAPGPIIVGHVHS